MRPGSAAAPVLVSVAYRQEPCRKPLRQTSLEALPTRLERSPPRGSPPRPSVQACVAGMTPLQAVAKPLHPQMQVPVSPLVLHTPRAPQAALRTIVRSGSQSRAMDRCSGAIQAERVSMPPASRPLHGQWSHCAVPASSRSWQPTAASPRWPNKEQQEQIERLTRQVQELREQQKRHQEWAQIPMAALGTERQTQTLPLEEKGAKAPPDFQKVLNDIPTACRNSMALRSPMPEVSLSSPRQSISNTSQKLREAMGTFGVPAPPTPPQPREEEGNSQLSMCGPRSPSPSGTSPEQPRSFVLQQAKSDGGLSDAARALSGRTRFDDPRGSPGRQSELTPPSPPKLSDKCSTRLRLVERLDMAAPGSMSCATTECSGEQEFHPQPWSLPVPDSQHTGVTTSTNSTTSSAKSLKLSCKDSLDGTVPTPLSVSDTSRISHLVHHVAAQVTAKELAELRTFRNPPAVVCQVLEAVAVILGVSDGRWSSMRKLLDNNLLTRLSTLNPMELSHSQKNKLQMLLQVPTFTDGSLLERCPAVASLARWCSTVGSVLNGEEKVDLGGLLIEPDLWLLNEAELANVEDLTVMRHGVGCVTFHGVTDCRELVYCLPDVVVLNPGEVVIYPNQKVKPPVGSGLNKPSTIKLYGCHPKSQIFKDERAREKYKIRVKTMTEEKGADFIDYDCDQGVWQFRVSHF